MKNLLSLAKNNLLILAAVLLISGCNQPEPQNISSVKAITDGWKMQPESKLKGVDEKQISLNDFDNSGWYEAVVPGTVLGSLTSTGVIEDPYFGINMQKVDREQFKQPWWFRSSFQISKDDLGKTVSLRFNGINYRADLWVNGKKVAGKNTFAGTYRMFTFKINDYIKEGKNTLALKIWQHADGEYSIGFVDWNPLPRDRNMGIFRDVLLEINGGVKIRSPFVYSKVNKSTLNEAELFIQTELTNSTDKTVDGILQVDYEIGKVEKRVSLKSGETINCKFNPGDFKQLSVKNVKLWWPNGMGDPNLYNLKVKFIAGDKIIDSVEKKYGIREITSYLNDDKNRVFEVNGKFTLIKGAGWTDDLLLQDTKESVEAQIEYVHHMNLNSIRCEGFWGKDETLYDLCDKYGILVMIGWNCHWEWEEYLLKPCDEKYGGACSAEDIDLLSKMWFDQMMWLRNHPSIYIWMLGSDKLPIPELEHKYIEMFNEYDPSRPYATSAGGAGTENNQIVAEVPLVSEISGPTGMKMLGPYAYTPPVYWFTDTNLGGGYGFNTETCPGPNIPPLASLKKMLPEKSLWPIDKKYWEYHTGRNQFKTLDRFRKALDNRYGKSDNIEEFAFKCQVSNYELMRPMFEAFVAHKPKSTGVIQWMLNSAWPEMYWQLYDTYLQPNGAFYGTMKACVPLHAIYRYGFGDIYIANEDLQDAENISVNIRIFDINSKEIFTHTWSGNVKSNISKPIFKLPEIKNLTPVYFLKLEVIDKDKKEVDNSVYWLSTKKDIIDWEAAKKLPWPFYSPSKQYADYTALDKLPKVKPEVKYNFEKEGDNGKVTLKVTNSSQAIMFFTYFDIVDADSGLPVLPVFWDDNYVTMFPGESKTFGATFSMKNAGNKKPVVKIKAWNVDMITLK